MIGDGPQALSLALDESNLAAYLREQGIVPAAADVQVDALSGGISNVVLRARWDAGCVVVKQSLPRLRVAVEWEFDRRRIFVERDCMQTLAEILPGSAPTVTFSDDPQFVFGMSCAPADGVVWKDSLLAGEIVPERTLAAAALLGGMQRESVGDAAIAAAFDDRMPLLQGRVDPYHRTAACAHPDLAERIEAEVQRMLSIRSVLVHGDFSPKNLIAYPDRMLMLDFEVAHWGDPAFDPAFLLSHFVMKAWRDERTADEHVNEAVRFWGAYREAAGPAVAIDESAVVAELGCLLLARVDGKSPIEYLTTPEQTTSLTALARVLLLDAAGDGVEDALARARRLSYQKDRS